MSFNTLGQTHELGCLLLTFLAFTQVILYVHEWPFVACGAESWVLHVVDGFMVSGGGKGILEYYKGPDENT
jgi:hypothetical protein